MFTSRFKPLLDLIILVGPFFLHFSFSFLFYGLTDCNATPFTWPWSGRSGEIGVQVFVHELFL
jgi:hypothetical protein